MKTVLSILFFITGAVNALQAQNGPGDSLIAKNKYVIVQVVDGDTVKVVVDEVIKTAAKSDEEQKKYLRLVRDVKKAMPYAKLAAFRLQMMEDNLATLTTERAKRKYIRSTEKAIKEEFMASLKNLTITQGKILIKLIHRETGKTAWDIMKKYRGAGEAILWQTLGKFYDQDMKEEFDPAEDYQIEFIIKAENLE